MLKNVYYCASEQQESLLLSTFYGVKNSSWHIHNFEKLTFFNLLESALITFRPGSVKNLDSEILKFNSKLVLAWTSSVFYPIDLKSLGISHRAVLKHSEFPIWEWIRDLMCLFSVFLFHRKSLKAIILRYPVLMKKAKFTNKIC